MVKVIPDIRALAGAPFCLHEAVAILERILNNKSAFLSVFKEVGLIFFAQPPEAIDEDELWELSRVYLKEIYLTSSCAIPTTNKTNMVHQDSATQTILLDLSLFQVRPDPEEAVYSRALFVLLVKLLHGSAHCLIPVFNRWARMAHNDPMPTKAGTMYAGTTDKPGACGLALEALLFGGRVHLPAPLGGIAPLEVGVRLLLRSTSTTACQCVEYVLKDTYINRVLDVFATTTEENGVQNLRTFIPIYNEEDIAHSDMILLSALASTSARSMSNTVDYLEEVGSADVSGEKTSEAREVDDAAVAMLSLSATAGRRSARELWLSTRAPLDEGDSYAPMPTFRKF